MGSAAAAAVISDEERVMNAGCGCKGTNHYEGLDSESVRLNRLNFLEMEKPIRDAVLLGKLDASACLQTQNLAGGKGKPKLNMICTV